MQTSDQQIIPKKSLKARIMKWLGLTNEVTIKLYHGYGHVEQFTIHGHIFKLSPLPRRKYRKSFIHNTWALLRLFMVKPYPDLKVELQWFDQVLHAETDQDGFFKFDWKDEPPLPVGWQEVTVQAKINETVIAKTTGHVYVPYDTQYGFISDIDDTFLISHSANLRKRLFVLFTQNARSRQPFEGVVKHYQLLANSNTTPEAPNPFFFVSSSEWNLYDYLVETFSFNKLPEGVFMLNQIKQWKNLIKTGKTGHEGKLIRVMRILDAFPNQKFVFFGDNSQQDPDIYSSIALKYPKNIEAIYIRNIRPEKAAYTEGLLAKVAELHIHTCMFTDSQEAIDHSARIGLISL